MWRQSLYRLFYSGKGKVSLMTPNNVVLVTGCDSGLGFAMAEYCHSLNMTVVCACHNLNSKGSKLLRELNHKSNSKRMITVELDLLKVETMKSVEIHLRNLLLDDTKPYQFTALVNNAGMMCIGEYEWQTWPQIEQQINVNLLGTMRLTKIMLPLIRQHKARIINITSHCGLQALNTFSVYAASKAGLRFWNDALRIEMLQYDVNVINLVPGSHVLTTNISALQQEHSHSMFNHFNEEQKSFYGAYFHRFNDYLRILSGSKAPNEVKDSKLMEKFHNALTDPCPKAVYINEPLRYKLYRWLFQWLPMPLVDWLVVQFTALPTYKQCQIESSQFNKYSEE